MSATTPGDLTDPEGLFDYFINLQTANNFLIQKYVLYRFWQYSNYDMADYRLWNAINFNFKDFTKDHFDGFNGLTWNIMRDYCYLNGYWIDHNYGLGGKTCCIFMLKFIEVEWNNK